jgi:hypothetical protein
MTIGGALSELNNLLKADDIPVYYKPSIKAVMDTIALSNAEKPNKWIPLDEKEPKDGQLIFVTLVNMYDKRYVQIAEFREEVYRKYDGKIDQRYYGFHSVDDIYSWGDKTVAWMPLPEPYQPEIPTVAEEVRNEE